ncbi:MAG: transposase [Gemmatimonadetes bacterium]|nr:transposase [Gemmatimonadota bacterium]
MGGFGKAISPWASVCDAIGARSTRRRSSRPRIQWLGIRSTTAYVGEPECNGVAERIICTLKEECIYLRRFETLEVAER